MHDDVMLNVIFRICLVARQLHIPNLQKDLRSSCELCDKIINLLRLRPKENALNLRQNSQYLWKILLNRH